MNESNFDALLKNDDSAVKVGKKYSKKLRQNKIRIGNICRSINIDSSVYSPQKTIDSIKAYLNDGDKIDRILYSEISAFTASLDEMKRGTFSTNIEKLLLFVLEESNNINEDVRKICIKIYDHFQLNLIQIEKTNAIVSECIVKAIEEEKIDLHDELKGIEKDHITILGIFAAIMLAFVGGFTFSTSVFNNVSDTNIYKLAFIALVVGLVFVIMIIVLMNFLREISGKPFKDEDMKCWINAIDKIAIVILSVLIVIVLICHTVVMCERHQSTKSNLKIEDQFPTLIPTSGSNGIEK